MPGLPVSADGSTRVYIPVVCVCAWPSQSETFRRSLVACRTVNAQLCLKTCGCTGFSAKRPAERLAYSTGNVDPSSGGSGGEWEGFILSGSAIQGSRLCCAVSSAKSEDPSARNRDTRLLSRAAPRNNTHCVIPAPRARCMVRERSEAPATWRGSRDPLRR